MSQIELNEREKAVGSELSPRVMRNTMGVSPKKRPPISPAWIHPGLVTGGARSRNHKKSRLVFAHVWHISWTDLQCM